MKNYIKLNKIYFLFSILLLVGCSDYIEIENLNEVGQDEFYRDETEFNLALNGCYNTLRAPIADEWMLTEIRSDNTFMNNYGTTNAQNLQIYSNDIFEAPSFDLLIQRYWATSYQSIRSINSLLEALETNYNAISGTIDFNNAVLPISDVVRKNIAGEASFMRAYHYFNLVRLYGGVFLVDKTISSDEALTLNRASVDDIYKFIIADLKNAVANCVSKTYSEIATVDRGKANKWSAEALLAKVYLTRGQKAEALTLLTDVISSSGYSLLLGTNGYSNVFSEGNEMNAEILFAIRFKEGGLGNGSSLSNLFGPTAGAIYTQTGLVNPAGTDSAYNTPTEELYNSYDPLDVRRNYNIKIYKPSASSLPSAWTYWAGKHNTATTILNDSELDWPVLRFSDVLLMYCEADGTANATTLNYLNQVHTRAGLTAIAPAAGAAYEKAVADERRWEFALENQRWFDLLRFNTTMSTITAEDIMINHFVAMEPFYAQFNQTFTPTELQSKVLTSTDKFKLLPIPNIEIITNTTNPIQQNSGY